MDERTGAQSSFSLLAFMRQDVTVKSSSPFHFSGSSASESLRGASVCFYFWHFNLQKLIARCQDHKHDTTFHLGRGLDCGVFIKQFKQLFKDYMASIGVGKFPPPESDRYLDFISLGEEFSSVFRFDFQVVGVGFGPNLDLFDLNCLLLFFGNLGFLALLILEFAEIHYPANGWIRVGSNLHEIQPYFFCGLNGCVFAQNA